MNQAFYTSRVWRTFHRLPTLAVPVAFIMVSLTWDFALMLRSKYYYPALNLTVPRDTFLIPLALGLSALGMDTSEGVLPVLLTRPLPRWTYVLGHWAALATVACSWSMLHLLLQWGLNHFYALRPVESVEVLYNAMDRLSLCIGMAAVLVCFSARLPSSGNVLLWIVLYFMQMNVLPGLVTDDSFRLGTLLRHSFEALLMPTLDWRKTLGTTPVSWFQLTTYLSNVSLLLLLAIHIFNRREVSYASR